MEVIIPDAAEQGLMGIKTPLLDHHYMVDVDHEVVAMDKSLVLPGTRRRQLIEEEDDDEANGRDDEEKDDSFTNNNTSENSNMSEVKGSVDTQNFTTNVYFNNKDGDSSKVGKNLKGKDLDVDIQEILTAVINGKTEVGKENLIGKDLDVDIQEILTAVINDKTEVDSSAQNENLQVDIVDEIDEEVIELEFERAVEKIHAHHGYEMYCPNCSNRITKVVLRRRIVKKIPTTSDKPLDLLGCLSCFSIFVAAGNKLNPFRMFGRDKETRSSSSVSNTQSTVHQQQASTFSNATQTNDMASTTITTTSSSSTQVTDMTSTVTSSSTQVTDMMTSTITSSSTQVKAGKVFDLLSIFKKGRIQENDTKVQSSTDMTADKTTNQGSTTGDRVQVSSLQGSEFEGNAIIDINKDLVKVLEQHGRLGGGEIEESDVTDNQQQGNDVRVNIEEESVQTVTPEFIQSLTVCKLPVIVTEEPSSISLEVVKSIVYGGLMELIASLSIVSSGAASGVTTMNILALGLANLVSGLVILGTNFRDMKYDENSESVKKYRETLGRKEHFLIHAVVGVLSYIAFGMVPLVTYGFAFRVSDNQDYKILTVAGASLFCIVILAIMKAYTLGQHKFSAYFKTVLYYITCAAMVSGIAYAVGDLASKLMEKWGLWDSSPVNALFLKETKYINPTFASY